MSQSSFIAVADALPCHRLLVRDADGECRPASRAEVLEEARRVLAHQVRRGATLTSPAAVKDHLRIRFAGLEHEVFAVVFLDAQSRLIDTREMFRGTATQTSVYPREVVKEALKLNAVAVILAHNHPSGVAEPSRADEYLTQTLKSTLALIDVRVLDHMVVAGADVVSFVERGLL